MVSNHLMMSAVTEWCQWDTHAHTHTWDRDAALSCVCACVWVLLTSFYVTFLRCRDVRVCVCIVRLQRFSSVRVCITDIIIRVYNITTRCILIRHTTSAHDIFLYDTTTSLYDTFSCDITVRYILRLQRCALLGTNLIAPCKSSRRACRQRTMSSRRK